MNTNNTEPEFDIEAYNRKHGYAPTPGHDDRRIIATMRARDDYLLGRFPSTAGPQPKAEREAEVEAHEEALATARELKEQREAFLIRAGVWADQAAHIAQAAARDFLTEGEQ
jgi:hypothetical protein